MLMYSVIIESDFEIIWAELFKASLVKRMFILLVQKPCETISIFHGCMVWIEKSVTRVTDRHHEACRVMPNSDPE